jgi:hypothetical protein
MSKVTFTTYTSVAPQDRLEMLQVSTIQPGSPVITTDGKTFRVVKFAEAVAAGKMVQAPAIVADFEDLIVATDVSVNAKSISVTLGAAGVTANQFEGATIVVSTDAGEGVHYTVAGHNAADPASVLVLNLEENVAEAMSGTLTVVSILPNPYVDVINAPTTLTNKVVGVAVTAAAAGDYGFVQTAGTASVLADGAVAVNTPVYASAGVSGAVAAAANGKIVGIAQQALVDTEFKAVDLTME